MKKIGVGYENYKDFTEWNLYYVDKTLLVRDILEKGGKVTLFTRPRRFGKTLALSMLRTFFEAEYDRDGNSVDNSRYFIGTKIMECDDTVLSQMGKYPVIHLSLKSAKQPDFRAAFLKVREEIIGEFARHAYVLDSENVPEEDKEEFSSLRSSAAKWEEKIQKCKDRSEEDDLLLKERDRFATSIKTLSHCLKLCHNRDVIILLDEYDVPLENAYFSGFYDEMSAFIRSLFESSLKTNDALHFAVITGCLRISKESIFTGLNHLKMNSVLSDAFAEGFGFTQEETDRMLTDYGLDGKKEEVREWYDGYLFGNREIYNPWSLICYVDEHLANKDIFPKPYWANTSSNSVIKDLVLHANEEQRQELDLLIGGGSIEKHIHEDITYDDIHGSEDNLWNFLFFTGYMKKVAERSDGKDIYLTMCIPNTEIRSVYRDHIRVWFEKKVKAAERSELYTAIKDRDCRKIGEFLTDLLKQSISTFDSEEAFYHGYMLSMLIGMQDYTARSNREEGIGRPDITLYPENPADPAYIFEIKIRKKFSEMQDGIEEDFRQIKDKQYQEGILDEGYAGVVSYGVCFCKKACVVEEYKG